MNPVNLAWIIPLIVSFCGAIYGFGRLVQRVSNVETNMNLLRDAFIRLEKAVKEA